MIGVSTGDIVDFAASSTSGKVSSSHLRSAASLDSITLTYTVSAISIYTALELSAQLQDSVSNGAYDATLQLEASALGATALKPARAGPAVVTYPTSTSDAGGKVRGPPLSTGAVVGIVGGVLAGLVLLAVWLGALRYCQTPPSERLVDRAQSHSSTVL